MYSDTKQPEYNIKELVGVLLYAAIHTRIDIAHAVSWIASHVNDPRPKHIAFAIHIFGYLKNTLEKCICFTREKDTSKDMWRLEAYVDSDRAADPATRRSRSGFLIMLCNAPLLWNSALQKTVSLSSTEAELIALINLGQELNYILRLTDELGMSISKPITVYEDNESTIKIAINPFAMKRTRHIQIRSFKLKEWQADGTITLKYIPTTEQLADFLTKKSTGPVFQKALNALMTDLPTTKTTDA